MTDYSIDVHAHRFAIWSANRAAGRGIAGLNFALSNQILRRFDIEECLGPDSLPNPGEIDREHQTWCEDAIKLAASQGVEISHGVAAKLINVYLKSRFVCGGYHFHPKVTALHPPIDFLLLRALAQKKVKGFPVKDAKSWTQFKFDDYQRVIDLIRAHLAGESMWMIEKYWDLAAVQAVGAVVDSASDLASSRPILISAETSSQAK
ncbi:hypothetical protein U8Q05_25870 [Rhizobium ruizarguesonis]|nr:hypothetical protein U8Q05_25870 [Rhizobium ruizarguesonis]